MISNSVFFSEVVVQKQNTRKCKPLRTCFFVVFLKQWLRPGTGFISFLLTGGGCSTSLGGLVRHTGKAAALIRIPVIPEIQNKEQEIKTLLDWQDSSLQYCMYFSFFTTIVCIFTCKCRVKRTESIKVLHWDSGHTVTEDTISLFTYFSNNLKNVILKKCFIL